MLEWYFEKQILCYCMLDWHFLVCGHFIGTTIYPILQKTFSSGSKYTIWAFSAGPAAFWIWILSNNYWLFLQESSTVTGSNMSSLQICTWFWSMNGKISICKYSTSLLMLCPSGARRATYSWNKNYVLECATGCATLLC